MFLRQNIFFPQYQIILKHNYASTFETKERRLDGGKSSVISLPVGHSNHRVSWETPYRSIYGASYAMHCEETILTLQWAEIKKINYKLGI